MRVIVVALILTAQAWAGDSIFEFHSGFWVNLHHFLYEQAMADKADGPSEWLRAVAYYRESIVKKDLLAPESEAINNLLATIDDHAALKGLDPELIAVLEAAAPVYRARWWPEHDRGNRAWIRAVEPLVAKHGDGIQKELARIYEMPWPEDPVRVDVLEFAKREGAYTTLEPTHINVSSVNEGNQGDAALEILFHEASHALIAKVRDALSAEVTAEKKLLRRRDLWHAVLFYTAGEEVRKRVDGYTPYAFKFGLYERSWQGVPEILESDWKPYLDGKIDFDTAIRGMVRAYAVEKAATSMRMPWL